MIRVAFQTDKSVHEQYRRAIARIRGVEAVDEEPADALITGSPKIAAESALPCLLDQPQRSSLGELSSLANRRIMPAHRWRFRPDFAAIQRSLAAGQLGDAALLRIQDWRASLEPGTLVPDAFPQIDLALWFFATHPDTAFRIVRPDYLQAHLGFPGGGMTIINVAQSLDDDYRSLHLIGSRGAAYLDDHHDRDLLTTIAGSDAPERNGQHEIAVKGMLEEFVAGIREERSWSVGLEDAIAALTTLEEVSSG